MAKIIDGKLLSEKIKEEVKVEVKNLREKGISVCLAVIMVGDDPASKIYFKNKKRVCETVGIVSKEFILNADISQQELINIIDSLNKDEKVNGILVQLPLPKHLDEKDIIASIVPSKDVDAFHPMNVGKIMLGEYDFLPCTPAGIINLIDETGISIEGKNCVIIGRSNIVGKPISMLLLQKNGTVTICHSKTQNLKDITNKADILVAAIGCPNFVKEDMIKPGAVVIDVGINRLNDGSLCGDVNFDGANNVAEYITPVPGGVGPMTIAMLMKNTLLAAKLQNSKLVDDFKLKN